MPQREIRTFIEEVCADLCVAHHVLVEGLAPEDVRVRREFALGPAACFADIRVHVEGQAPYFVEVKGAGKPERLARALARKYGPQSAAAESASRLILAVPADVDGGVDQLHELLSGALHPGLELEIWQPETVLERVHGAYGIDTSGLGVLEDAGELRNRIRDAMWLDAFGPEHRHSPMKTMLLWQFGTWGVRRLAQRGAPEDVLPEGGYPRVVALIADLSGFSSYVRDTPSPEIVHFVLSRFYSASRDAVLDHGGMLYRFMGDAVLAFFGMPEHTRDCESAALSCAEALLDIGASVSHEWQRLIDRVQDAHGVHVGIAMGGIEMVPLRVFQPSHLGAVGDTVNLAARLGSVAKAGEIVVSNALFHALAPELHGAFESIPSLEAKNVGRIKAWRRPAES